MTDVERARAETLFDDLLGADEARCVAARDELEAMGAFRDPETRAALQRAVARPRVLPFPSRPRRIGGFPLGAIVGRGGFAFVRHTELEGAGPVCIKLAYMARAGAERVTRLVGPVSRPHSQGVAEDERCANGLRGEALGVTCVSVSESEASAILEAEAAFLRGCEGDLFPAVHASGVENERAWYVMDLLEGESLRSIIRGGRGADVDLRVFARLARELGAMHERDGTFFHGDLKPENLVLSGDRLRTIDPSARSGASLGLKATITVAYNPFALTGEKADTLALALTILETRFGIAPFATLRQPLATATRESGREEAVAQVADAAGLPKTLLAWIAEPPTYAEMDRALRRHAKTG